MPKFVTNAEWTYICAKKPKTAALNVERVVNWVFTKAYNKKDESPHRMLWSFIQATYREHPDWFIVSPFHNDHISIRIENLGGIATHWCNLHINLFPESSFVKNVTMVNWDNSIVELVSVNAGQPSPL